MTGEPFRVTAAPPARRALSDKPPPDVAAAAAEFLTGALVENPWRVGKPLRGEFEGVYSARLGRAYRVLYEIHLGERTVVVLNILPRASAYRRR